MHTAVTVATWNIGSLYANFDSNLQYLEKLLSQQTVDILCMQEVPAQESLLHHITTTGGFQHCIFKTTSQSHICQENDMGIAVFSRYTITQLDSIKLNKPTVPISYNGKPEIWHDKYFMAVLCEKENKKLILVTGHGFPFHRYQLEQPSKYAIISPSFEHLDNWIELLHQRYPKTAFCMAADFNIKSPLFFMQQCNQQYVDIFENEGTRPSGRKTDAILLPHKTPVLHKENIKSPIENGCPQFDHNYISACFSI